MNKTGLKIIVVALVAFAGISYSSHSEARRSEGHQTLCLNIKHAMEDSTTFSEYVYHFTRYVEAGC